MKVAIIGGGNLGSSIARGLAQAGAGHEISVSRRHPELLASLAGLGVFTTSDNSKCIEGSELIILAVKPFQAEGVLGEIAQGYKAQPLVSCVAGLEIETIRKHMGKDAPVFRAMPNTAISRRQSMTCIAPMNAEPEARNKVEALFNQLGEVAFMEEKMMDAATVLGACGIAYAMRYIRAAMQAGIQIGFDSQTSLRIVSQTVKGAASLLLENHTHPEEEIDKVTTPRGCTIVGLNEMEHQGMSSAVIKGIQSSFRAVEDIGK